MKTLTTLLISLICTGLLANQAISTERVFNNKTATNKLAAILIVDLVKTTSLKTDYEKFMLEAYDFLPPEFKIPNSKVENLEPSSLSQWTPNSYFSIGRGDYELCDINTEEASVKSETQLVGFDTSYKRGVTYGFWGNFTVDTDWCELNGTVTKSRVRVTFNKWIKAAAVDALLYQFSKNIVKL